MAESHAALAQQVRLWRAQAGLSQRAAAQEAAVSPTTWRKLEAGAPVRDQVLARVAAAMGVPAVQLLRLAAGDTGAAARPDAEPGWRVAAAGALERIPERLGPAVTIVLSALAEPRRDDRSDERRSYP